MALVRAALRNPYLVAVLALGLVVLGLVSLGRIPADLLPVFKTPAIQVVTFYPGMPAVVMERDIMSRLERWTGQSVGIAHQEGKAMTGVCVVKNFFREDIDPNTAMSQVTSLAMSDLFYLPPGTVPPMVMPFDPTASTPLCLLAVSSPTLPENRLYDLAYFEMRNQLQAIPGVIAPAVYGGVLRRILAYLDRDALEARGLSPMDVHRALRRENVLIPTGNAKLGDIDYLVLANGMPETVSELDDFPLKVEDGSPVLLRDVGVARDAQQIQTNVVRVNGRRQVYIPIYRQPGENTLRIVDEVKARADLILQRIRSFFPDAQDMRIDVVMDQTEFVRGSIRTLSNAAALGAVLVGAVVLLLIVNVRATAIALLALPLSFLAAFLGLFATGDSLNAMTLGGLSLAVGVLIDYACVVLDNVARHRREGLSPLEAASRGAGEVALPIAVSALTLLVVFLPVVFLTGIAKFLFTPLALAVTFATAAAYLVSLTVLPAACARFLPARPPRSVWVERVGERYAGLVRFLLRRRVLVALASGLLLGSGAFAASRLGTELFPTVDARQLAIHARVPVGTRIERTEEILVEVERSIQAETGPVDPERKDPKSELRTLITNIGVLMDWPAAYTPNSGPADAFVLLQLKPQRKRSAQALAERLRSKLAGEFPGVEFSFDTGGMLTSALNFGLPAPIQIQVQGSSLDTLYEIARAVAEEARSVRGAVDVRIGEPPQAPALQIDVDRTKAALLGLSQEDVVKNVVSTINSSVNFDPAFWIDPQSGNHYFLGVQYPEEEIRSFETLENIPITSPKTKRPVLLKNLATFRRTTTPAVVQHRNITRTVNVFAGVSGRDLGGVAAEIERRLAASPAIRERMDLFGPKGYRISTQGEIARMRESFGDFAKGLGVAAILIYLAMVAQFRSFRSPLLVMATVPVAFAGAFLALRISGSALSIPSSMGLILTLGIVVEYAILFVDFADRARAEGRPSEEAVVEAARRRLRPILMTSLTTVFALLPLALSAEANAPLARAVLGGVLAATAITLFALPVLYTLLVRRIAPAAAADV
ncbi:MAG: efflux RND transporter permease subunit [Planctomycetota bacterium]